MTRARWEELRASLRERFKVLDEYREELEDRPGQVEGIELETPAGKFRLEFTEAARVTGVATSSGRKVGTAGRITRTFSADESVERLDAYRLNGEHWEKIDPEAFV